MQITNLDVGAVARAEPGEKLASCPPELVVNLLRQQGYVLFTGFAPTVAEHEAFTGQFGSCADTRHVHYPESGGALGFHAEDAYNPYRPDALWFFCVHEGSDGGVPTGVVDGVELLQAMPPEWRAFSCRARLRFDRQWEAAVWQGAAPVTNQEDLAACLKAIPGIDFEFLGDGSLYIGYEVALAVRTATGQLAFSNTLLQAVTDPEFYGMSLAGGSPVPDELLVVAQKLAQEREREIAWSTGDVAVIDNLRLMHRRREYHQKDRDLRARHCEDFFGTWLPAADTPLQAWTKSLIQGDVQLPARTGRPRHDREGRGA